MDQHKLRSLVFEKTGVKIDVDDPVFALVALNEAVLEEAVERHVAQIDAATRELIATTGATPPAPAPRHHSSAAAGTQSGAARDTAAHAYDAAADAGLMAAQRTTHTAGSAAGAARAAAGLPQPVLLAAGTAVGAAVLTLLGQALFFKPQPIPAPIVQARELTAGQAAALRDAEKLTRIVEKLDPKTRALIKSEMQKP